MFLDRLPTANSPGVRRDWIGNRNSAQGRSDVIWLRGDGRPSGRTSCCRQDLNRLPFSELAQGFRARLFWKKKGLRSNLRGVVGQETRNRGKVARTQIQAVGLFPHRSRGMRRWAEKRKKKKKKKTRQENMGGKRTSEGAAPRERMRGEEKEKRNLCGGDAMREGFWRTLS